MPFYPAYVWATRPLMMQEKPTITSGEVTSLLQRKATEDCFTGDVPNLRWGYDKLDLAAVRAILNAIRRRNPFPSSGSRASRSRLVSRRLPGPLEQNGRRA